MHDIDSQCAQFFDVFETFLEKTSQTIYDIAPGKTTQINESVNHHFKKFINKLFAFRGSYSTRTAISILDWNNDYYIFDILERISSTQILYTVFLESVKREIDEKKKGRDRRTTDGWKKIHQQEKLKKNGNHHQKVQVHIK